MDLNTPFYAHPCHSRLNFGKYVCDLGAASEDRRYLPYCSDSLDAMATPNPMANTYPMTHSPISKKGFCIAGVLVAVYGLDELDAQVQDTACLWLLHPRLQNQECMAPVAASTITAWREKKQKTKKEKALGLICVSFDQRNHGSREVDALSNEAWRNGNKTHAQDMFASYRMYV